MRLEIPYKAFLERKTKNSFYKLNETFLLLKMNADIDIETISKF